MPEQGKALESQLEDKIIMVNKTTKTKKSKMVSNEGVAHILATFNNTIINITDKQGNTVAWSSSVQMVLRVLEKALLLLLRLLLIKLVKQP
mgnify:CR=1 FL=1